MNKKGFTLMELLSVIAILAIIVVFTVPRVIGMYEKSQINVFKNEAEGYYKAVHAEILSQSLINRTQKVTKEYSSFTTSSSDKIDLEGKSLIYCVKVSENNITDLAVSDGVYQIKILDKTNIQAADVVSIVEVSINNNALEITDENPLFTSCD